MSFFIVEAETIGEKKAKNFMHFSENFPSRIGMNQYDWQGLDSFHQREEDDGYGHSHPSLGRSPEAHQG